VVQCADIISRLLVVAEDRIGEIDAFSCLTQLLFAVQMGESDLVRDQYSGVCNYDQQKMLDLIVEVPRVRLAKNPYDTRSKEFAAETIKQFKYPQMFSCANFDKLDKDRTIRQLNVLISYYNKLMNIVE
jgi:hypothetical protein